MVDLTVGADAKITLPASSILDQFDYVPERWAKAEQVAHELIQKVQLTAAAEERRDQITGYVQRLIRSQTGAEVFPYGSVPLKTYLPDGDIDLTVFGGASDEQKLADKIKFALEEETKNNSAEYVVKDVQLINAEVKIVKCIVQDIVVDISLSQIGGLSALCFLEQVDRYIGKDHLFKRSVLLTKTWCYYESRILGAYHGLISTYALEIMVLYIFHLFYSTLNGPLSVLQKFLEYFSKFDWETYCLSLKGPVRISALPDIAPEIREDSFGGLMLPSDFLSPFTKAFSIPSTNFRGFQLKHLNIIDPLKETNNLGRSVNKANFYRIRSAFNYGAQRLDRILLQPVRLIPTELHRFFSDSMARHGGGQRHDVQDFVSPPTCNANITDLPVSKAGLRKNDVLSFERQVTQAMDLATSGMQGLGISSESPDTAANDILLDSGNPSTLSWYSNNLKWNHGTASRMGTSELLNYPVDLTGDYEGFFYGLEYGRRYNRYTSAVASSPLPPPRSPPLFHINNPQDDAQSPSQLLTSGVSFRHPNSFHTSSPVYALPHLLLPPVVAYGWDEMPKPRGTGTYFPNTDQPPLGYRPSALTVRNHVFPRIYHSNGRNLIFFKPSMIDRSLVEPAPFSESRQVSAPSYPNSLTIEREPAGTVELRAGHAFRTSIQEVSRQQTPVSSSPRSFPATQKPQLGFSKEHDR